MKKYGILLIKIVVGCVFLAFALFPIILLISSSLKIDTEVFDYRIIPKHVSFDAFKQVFTTLDVFTGIKNSLFVATMVTILALLVHSMAAFAFARLRFPGKKAAFMWVLSTMMIPFPVIIIPLFFIIKSLGLVNSLWGMILPMVPHAYGVFLFRQYFVEMPDSLYESARIDGCSIFQTFRKIYVPLAKPMFITLGVSFFVTNWNSYLLSTIVAQDKSKYTIQIQIATLMGSLRISWNQILAASVVAIIPTVLIFGVLQRYYLEGIKTTGMKD